MCSVFGTLPGVRREHDLEAKPGYSFVAFSLTFYFLVSCRRLEHAELARGMTLLFFLFFFVIVRA